MYLQEILEVGIGLVFVWLIISIAAMQFQEWIANLLKWRSHDLETAIRRMLSGEDPKANAALQGIMKEFYNHPLIKSLTKNPGKLEKGWVAILNFFRRIFKMDQIVPGRPSYIPNSKFALTVFDLVMNAGTDKSLVKNATAQLDQALTEAETTLASLDDATLKGKITEALIQALADAKKLAGSPLGDEALDSVKFAVKSIADKYPEAQQVTDFLIPRLDTYYNELVTANFIEAHKTINTADDTEGNDTLKRFRTALVGLGATNPALMESLRSLVTGAEGYVANQDKALATARKNVETWFDDSMARLSGWYKRKAQGWAFGIGIATALLLNVDSINLAQMLWREPTLRQAIVAEAQTYVNQNPDGVTITNPDGTVPNPSETFDSVQQKIQNLNVPVGWIGTPVEMVVADPAPAASGDPATAEADAPVSRATVTVCNLAAATTKNEAGELVSLTGYQRENVCYPLVNAFPFTKENIPGWLTKVLGILITGAAAAQGAPFWFDILKKLINVRSSGPNPAEAKPKA